MANGAGCRCSARDESECGCCGVDWRSEQHINLIQAAEVLLTNPITSLAQWPIVEALLTKSLGYDPRDKETELEYTCAACGERLEKVRDGKYQCNNCEY